MGWTRVGGFLSCVNRRAGEIGDAKWMRELMFWTRRKLFVAGLALFAGMLGGEAIALAQPPADASC